MKEHELVSKLKELAHELGRSPTRLEFVNSGVSEFLVKKFGFSVLMDMAGLKRQVNQRFKANSEVFRVPLKPMLDEYVPREIIDQPKWPRILVLGDIHFPFHSKRALEAVYRFAEIFKPEHIVQMGDLYDMLAHSKFPRSHNTFSPEEEERLGREAAVEMWATLKKIAPKAECHQIVGNHDLRPLKRTLESAPTLEHWAKKYWEELMTFDGVKTVYDGRQELEIAGILFTHGFLGKEGAHRDYYLKNVVIGHLHKLWVQYRRVHGHQIFEVCAGFLAEPESKALTYNNSKLANYQLGFVAIDEFGPRVVHL